MPLFRRQDTQHERTPEEREYARRVREARRRGLPDPEPPASWGEPEEPFEPVAPANGHHAEPVELPPPIVEEPAPVEQGTVEWSAAEAFAAGEPAAEVVEPAPLEPPPAEPPPAAPAAAQGEPLEDPWDAPLVEPEAARAEPPPAPAAPEPAATEPPADPSLPPIVTPMPRRRRTVRLIPSRHDEPVGGLPPAPARSSSSTAGFPAVPERRGLLDRLRERRDERAAAQPEEPPAGNVPAARRRGELGDGHDEKRERLLERIGHRAPAAAAAGAADPADSPRRRFRPPPGPPIVPRAETAEAEPRRRPIVRRVLALVALLVVAAIAAFAWLLFQPFGGSGQGRVVVTIPRGASTSQIADLLARRGVIAHPFFFELRAKIDGKRSDFRAGTFDLRHGMSYASALQALTTETGAAASLNVTIPEGRSRKEMAPLLARAGVKGSYRAASQSSPLLSPHSLGGPRGASLEGFLFPSTYQLARGHATAQDLVADQLKAFRQNFAQVNLHRARKAHLTAFDVVTIASMVEREAAVQRDRPLIAAVIWNRLRLGMPLGIDATLRYALNDWDKPLLESQLKNPTPYNTRLHQGLPPGPIGNPGLASLQAAANPAHVSYLYYVVQPGTCGKHVFSSTYAQFQRDVQRYQNARAANGGRSPTKC